MKKNPLTIIIGILLIIIFGLWLFVFQVRKSEVVLITTFGKPTRAIVEPGGPYFKWPWPIQRGYRFDLRIADLPTHVNQPQQVVMVRQRGLVEIVAKNLDQLGEPDNPLE